MQTLFINVSRFENEKTLFQISSFKNALAQFILYLSYFSFAQAVNFFRQFLG